MSTNVETPQKIHSLWDIGRRFGASPHQILIDLQKWESFGFICTPKWAYALQEQGMDALQARLWLWRELAVYFARKVLPWDRDSGVFAEPIKVGSLWVRKKPLGAHWITMRVTEVDPDFKDGRGLVRAVCEPPRDDLGGCKHSFETFYANYTLEEESKTA